MSFLPFFFPSFIRLGEAPPHAARSEEILARYGVERLPVPSPPCVRPPFVFSWPLSPGGATVTHLSGGFVGGSSDKSRESLRCADEERVTGMRVARRGSVPVLRPEQWSHPEQRQGRSRRVLSFIMQEATSLETGYVTQTRNDASGS